MAKLSIKFVLPNDGNLIEDRGLRGLGTDKLNLPYPTIALEYVGDGDFPKRVVMASLTPDSLVVVGVNGNQRGWFAAIACVVPRDGWREEVDGDVHFRVEPLKVEAHDAIYPVALELCRADVSILLQFLNATQCSNVSALTIPARRQGKNARRLGALPFDEYKVLTLDIASSRCARDSAGAGRQVREHLRRGHIRRYESGKKIWINSMVVSAGVGSAVHKDYAVRP